MTRNLVEMFFSKQGKLVDKWEQYLGIYEREFAAFRARNEPIDLLEVGVQNGGSLELWGEYLPEGSTITGLDIDPKVSDLVFASDAVQAYVADGTDPEAVQGVLGGRAFDIIIDDGSHTSSDIKAAFKALFGRLKAGGLYIIEDLHCSYYPSHEGGFRQPQTSIEWLKRLVEAVNFDHLDADTVEASELHWLADMNRSVASVSFYDSVAVVEKFSAEKNRPFRRFVSGKESHVAPPYSELVKFPRSRLDAMLFGGTAARALEAALTIRADNTAADLASERARAERLAADLASEQTRAERLAVDLASERTRAERLAVDLASERARAERLAADLAWSEQGLAHEATARSRAEAERDEHRSSGEAAQVQAHGLSRDVDLLRGVLRGRDAVIDRLGTIERRAWLLAKVRDDLIRLLAKERDPSRDEALRALLAMRRNQAEALRRAWGEERQARVDIERRLTALERSRSWRLLATLRAVAGRQPPPHAAKLSELGAENLALLGAVAQTGLFDRAYYAEHNPDVADRVDPALHFARSGWREGRRPNPDFDPADYLARNPAVAAQGMNPLLHYADYGIDEVTAALAGDKTAYRDDGISPGLAEGDRADIETVQASFFFDASYYRAQYPDVVAAHESPTAHYVLTGWRELRDPSADFDTAFYLSQNPDVAASGANPLVHFIEVGQAEGRSPKASVRLPAIHSVRKIDLPADDLAAVEAVIETGLLDGDFYRSTYPDVVADGQPPAVHFALDGWREGRDPSVAFDTSYYLGQNGDVVGSGENPLVHYAQVGAAEGRHPLPQANPAWGVPSDDERLVREIRETGLFDEDFYCVHNPDIIKRKLDPVLHFAIWGWKEGRWPHPAFDPKFYLDTNPDVVPLGINPLLHYVRHGIIEGRQPCAMPIPFTHLGHDYARWVEKHDTLTDDDRRAILARLTHLHYQPLISVVMPVYNTDLRLLREAIGSIQAQLYPNWELCIADDASIDARVPALLRELAEGDPRIKIVVREENGHISASSNSALALATGEFVALMDHDDLIPEHALFVVVSSLNDDRNYDLIYSDEDHIDQNGVRCEPYFKSDFNPDLLLGHNFISHLSVYRRVVLESVGGFRLGYEGSQDYDLSLRVVDAIDPKRILHIPHILYHWRSSPGGATFSQNFLDQCVTSARTAIKDHLARTGQDGDVVDHPIVPTWHRIRRKRPDPAPLVSIIVPTKDKFEILKPCCDGILQRTDYPNIELIVVNHQSTDPVTIEYLDKISRDDRVTIVPYRGVFNYSAINNMAVRHAHGQIFAFLNNDIEVIGSDWLDEMIALASLPAVGVVGAKLLYPDGRVQHGGVVVGVGGVANHFHHLLGGDNPGYMGLAVLTATVSAVTGACLVVRRETFEGVGGFDEQNLSVTFNDVDLCLKIREAGFRNVMAAQAVLYHHESISRGFDTTPEKIRRFQGEAIYMIEKWGSVLKCDPFYNPNFDLATPNYDLAHPPRHEKPWSQFGRT